MLYVVLEEGDPLFKMYAKIQKGAKLPAIIEAIYATHTRLQELKEKLAKTKNTMVTCQKTIDGLRADLPAQLRELPLPLVAAAVNPSTGGPATTTEGPEAPSTEGLEAPSTEGLEAPLTASTSEPYHMVVDSAVERHLTPMIAATEMMCSLRFTRFRTKNEIAYLNHMVESFLLKRINHQEIRNVFGCVVKSSQPEGTNSDISSVILKALRDALTAKVKEDEKAQEDEDSWEDDDGWDDDVDVGVDFATAPKPAPAPATAPKPATAPRRPGPRRPEPKPRRMITSARKRSTRERLQQVISKNRGQTLTFAAIQRKLPDTHRVTLHRELDRCVASGEIVRNGLLRNVTYTLSPKAGRRLVRVQYKGRRDGKPSCAFRLFEYLRDHKASTLTDLERAIKDHPRRTIQQVLRDALRCKQVIATDGAYDLHSDVDLQIIGYLELD